MPTVDTVMDKMAGALFLLMSVVLFLVSEGVEGSQVCVYKKTRYNHLMSQYEKVLASENCQWGCCEHHSSPCCTAPISLIAGCILGGLLGISLLVVVLYCCCGCRRRRRNTESDAESSGARRDPTSVVFHSESSRHAGLEPSMSTFDLPPSYEEVMRGETNAGFKPD